MKYLYLGVALVGITFASVAFAGDCGIDNQMEGGDIVSTVKLCGSMLVPWRDKKTNELDMDAYEAIRGGESIRIPAAEVDLGKWSVEYAYLTNPGTPIEYKRQGSDHVIQFEPAQWDTVGKGAATGNWQVRSPDKKTVIYINLGTVHPTGVGRIVQKPANMLQPGETGNVLAFTFKKS